MAPAGTPGDARYPHVAYLTARYEPRDESGLPSSADEALLSNIEEHEANLLEVGGLSVQVGAVLEDGVKDLIFYTRDPELFSRKAGEIRDAHPELAFCCEIQRGPTWSHWTDLP